MSDLLKGLLGGFLITGTVCVMFFVEWDQPAPALVTYGERVVVLTNDEIIAEVKKCQAAGLTAGVIHRNGRPERVMCTAKCDPHIKAEGE